MSMVEFNFYIEHRPRKRNVSDVLSRHPVSITSTDSFDQTIDPSPEVVLLVYALYFHQHQLTYVMVV